MREASKIPGGASWAWIALAFTAGTLVGASGLTVPAVGVAFPAFVLWLGVRIANRRERWAKWTAVGVALVPVLYVISFGPACWLLNRTELFGDQLPAIYEPIGVLCYGEMEVPLVERVMSAYAQVGMTGKKWVDIPIGDGTLMSIPP